MCGVRLVSLISKFFFPAICWIAAALQAQVSSPIATTITSITFQGNKSIDARQLQSLLLISRAGNLYAPESLKAELQALEIAYQNEGFLRAVVGPPEIKMQNLGNAQSASILIPITEGPVFMAGKAAIKGAGVLGHETLLQLCPLTKGQPYSRAKIRQWQAKIAEAYQSLGYLRFESAVRENIQAAGHYVDFTVECAEGKPYVVGTIAIVGDKSIDPMEFKRRLLFHEGGAYNPEMLLTNIQLINQMQRYKPIANSDVEIKIDDLTRTADLTFRIALPSPK